jgi:hypothetical protein
VADCRRIKVETKACLLVLILAVCFPTASNAQTVTYNYAQGVNFAEFKMYDWVNIAGVGPQDPVLEGNLRAAIDAELRNKGLVKSHERAQLLVACQVSIGRVEQITMYEGYWNYGPGWSHSDYYGYSRGPIFVSPALLSTETGSTIQIGHLVLDMYDSAYRDLVWRGRVSPAISFGGEPNKREQRLNNAVAKLFKAYPRRPKE